MHLFRKTTDQPKSQSERPRIIFMGTPEFAETILAALLGQSYDIIAVYTRPDKPSGRKQDVVASPVKTLAEQHSIPVEQPTVFDEEVLKKLKNYRPDLIAVAAYGKIIPAEVLRIPSFGCLNVHPSLLPKFRGASPIQNALLQGEKETGTTIMLMDEGTDTGDLLTQEIVAIDPQDTLDSLSQRLAEVSAKLLAETIPLWMNRSIEARQQDPGQATLCQLIEREDGHIFWDDTAESIYNRFRALTPWPGIFGFWEKDGQLTRLKFIRISYQKQQPQTAHHLGEVFELGEKIGVQTASGVVFLEEVQLEGKTAVPIRDLIQGYPQLVGSVLK